MNASCTTSSLLKAKKSGMGMGPYQVGLVISIEMVLPRWILCPIHILFVQCVQTTHGPLSVTVPTLEPVSKNSFTWGKLSFTLLVERRTYAME